MFIPYLGFFRKISQADVFVVYDTAQYSRGDWHNRNRILTSSGVEWLTIPVEAKLHDTFITAKVSSTFQPRKQLEKIRQAYEKAPYFKEYFPAIEELYNKQASSLGEYNWNFISYILDVLDIKPRIVFASTLDMPNVHSTDALIFLTRSVGCDAYISGEGGTNYIEPQKFTENNIKLLMNDFVVLPYTQQSKTAFEPYLSTLDALMNVGAAGIRILIGL